MKIPYLSPKLPKMFSIAAGLTAGLFSSPAILLASEGSAEFFVAAWLVRLWLAMVCGTAIVVGVMLALDSYSSKHIMEPTLTADSQIKIIKKKLLSYRKIGGGLLCVFIGCAFFVTAVFLLPDKRTGHSGVNKILKRFNISQTMVDSGSNDGASDTPTQHH